MDVRSSILFRTARIRREVTGDQSEFWHRDAAKTNVDKGFVVGTRLSHKVNKCFGGTPVKLGFVKEPAENECKNFIRKRYNHKAYYPEMAVASPIERLGNHRLRKTEQQDHVTPKST